MRLTLGFAVLLSSCGGTAAPPAQTATAPAQTAAPPAQTAAPPAQTAAPPAQTADRQPVSASVTGIEVDDRDPEDPVLWARVSLANNTDNPCVVWAYELAWNNGADTVRVLGNPPGTTTSLDPKATTETKSRVGKQPMRDAMQEPNTWQVVDLLAVCPDPNAQPTPPPPVSGTVTGMSSPALEFRVSFENGSGGTCEVTSYSVAWDADPYQPRQPCPGVTTVAPNGTAEASCTVPDDAPMRRTRPHYADRGVVVDVVATCSDSK